MAWDQESVVPQPQDRPNLVTRVFKIKLKELINDIHKKHIMGHTIMGIYVIECQKCGLSHAHNLKINQIWQPECLKSS